MTTEMRSEFSPKPVTCPICSRQVAAPRINEHIDNGCQGTSSSKQSSTSSVRSKSKSSLAPIFDSKPLKSEPVTPSPATTQANGSAKGKKRAVAVNESSAPAHKRARMSALAPLAERMRPERLEDFIGHDHLTNPNSMFMNGVKDGSLGSMIFWGPPGCGKTTLARLYAKQTGSVFKELSATVVGINEVRAVFEEAKNTFILTQRRTVLFLDEIHRFNRSQQDIFLPFVEQGNIQLLGATTENPSFKLTGALLSRCRVFVLERLTDDDIEVIVRSALRKLCPGDEGQVPDASEIPSSPTLAPSSSQASQESTASTFTESTNVPAHITDHVMASLVSLSSGDARTALSLLELVFKSPLPESELITSIRQSVSVSYDRTGDSRYDMISALHKSVRGSQGSAAMYWLARMLTAGEDPLYIARRMVVCASEDIGLADPQALPLAMAALQACQTIGMPECRLNLAHVVAYLSEAPKSTRAYEAYSRAEEAAKSDQTIPVPLQVRNAPTKLLKEIGCGKEYHYNPAYAHPVTNAYMPLQFAGEEFLRKEGDMTDKMWDEDALRQWEWEMNGGRDWSGQQASASSGTVAP